VSKGICAVSVPIEVEVKDGIGNAEYRIQNTALLAAQIPNPQF